MAEFVSPVTAGAGVDLGEVHLDDVSGIPLTRTWDDPGVEVGRAGSAGAGIAFAVSPGEWILVDAGLPGPDDVDLTHVRAAIRVTGDGAADLLAHLCAIDLGDGMTPNRAAARTPVAGVPAELVRDDAGDDPSYLLLMSRSFAQHVWDALVSAGRAHS